jgi:hypothetical protein
MVESLPTRVLVASLGDHWESVGLEHSHTRLFLEYHLLPLLPDSLSVPYNEVDAVDLLLASALFLHLSLVLLHIGPTTSDTHRAWKPMRALPLVCRLHDFLESQYLLLQILNLLHWGIVTVLVKSVLNHHERVLLARWQVHAHVMPKVICYEIGKRPNLVISNSDVHLITPVLYLVLAIWAPEVASLLGVIPLITDIVNTVQGCQVLRLMRQQGLGVDLFELLHAHSCLFRNSLLLEYVLIRRWSD